MWPDRVSNPGPLTYESGALPTALRAARHEVRVNVSVIVKLLGGFFFHVMVENWQHLRRSLYVRIEIES